MAIDSVEINSAIGIDGNSYTTAVSNDKLTNDDFLKLLLEEMKMQDPTKPMDSQKMMDTQLQMSTIESNVAMTTAMTSLQNSYANSALSTAASLIGNIIENGELGDDGLVKSYKVETVENIDGEMYVNAKQLTGLYDNLIAVNGDEVVQVSYDANGYIYEDGSKTTMRVLLEPDGRMELDEEGNIVLLDAVDGVITDSDIVDKYKYNGSTILYSDEMTTISMSNILKVR